MQSPVILNHGASDSSAMRIPSGSGAVPRARTITAHHGEPLANIAQRAYGDGSAENIRRIENANANLVGEIRVPL